MANNVAPDVLMNSILGKISDVLLNGDGQVIPRSDDHYLAFMQPGIPFSPDSFNYAIEGFGGVMRNHADPEKLAESVGPNDGAAASDPSLLQRCTPQTRPPKPLPSCDLVPDTSGIVV